MSNAYKNAFWLFTITILSKIFGFIREMALTYTYGASMVSDVYIVSTGIPGILFASVTSALAVTFIPLFYEIDKISRYESLKFLNNITNIVIIISFIMIILGFLFTEELVKFFAIDFNDEKLSLAAQFTRIMLFGIIFTGLNNIITSWLQINNEFTIPAMTGLPFNIMVICSIIVSGFTNPVVMVFGTLFAMSIQVLFQIPVAKKYGYKYKLYINLSDKHIKKILTLLGPVFIGVLTSQLNAVIDRNLASTLEDGMITILNSASRLNGFVISLFIATISSVIYPTLSKLTSTLDDMNKFSNIVSKSINIIIIFIIPISIGIMVLSEPIIRIVFERGEFNSYATKMTAVALSCYSIGMVGVGTREILSKAFYSLQDTKSPMINGILCVILNIVLNICFIKIFGHAGLALATSISALLGMLLLMISLSKKIGYFGQDKIVSTFLKSIVSSILMGVLVSLIYNFMVSYIGFSFVGEGISLLVSVLSGAIAYVVLITLLKVDEVKYILNSINKK